MARALALPARARVRPWDARSRRAADMTEPVLDGLELVLGFLGGGLLVGIAARWLDVAVSALTDTRR